MKDTGQWLFNLAIALALASLYLRAARLDDEWSAKAAAVGWLLAAAWWGLALWLNRTRRPR